MSVDTDAILFYGIIERNEDEWREASGLSDEHHNYYDIDANIDAAIGFDRYGDPHWDYPQDSEEYRERKERYDRYVDAEMALGCRYGTHCHAESPMYFICASDSLLTANRGYPVRVSELKADPSWDVDIERYCEMLNIPLKKEMLGWHLASYWG